MASRAGWVEDPPGWVKQAGLLAQSLADKRCRRRSAVLCREKGAASAARRMTNPARRFQNAADAVAAEILGTAVGAPLLAIDRVTLTYGDKPVEFRRGLCTTRSHHYANTLS